MRTNPPYWLYKRTRVLNLLNLLGLVGPHSQMNEIEKACLAKYARGKKALEIGTYMGVTASIIAAKLEEGGTLYCVDPYTDIEICFDIAKRQLKRKNVFQKVKFLRGYSNDQNIISQIPKDLDFILIDGDHSYEGLENDWKIVSSNLVSNGVVCLHDTTIPKEEPYRDFGSVKYFNDIIMADKNFVHKETVYSMNVLVKK